MPRVLPLPSLLAITAALLAACEAPVSLGPQGALEDVVTRVTALDGAVTATYHGGAAPAGGTGAAPTALAAGAAVNGGSALLSLSAAAPFHSALVTINGTDGYYELTLPSDTNAVQLVLGIAPATSSATLPVRAAVEGDDGASQYAAHQLTLHQVGTGDVQVSVSWSGASDVDLRVTDPGGTLIYFDSPSDASGGTLDLDSNAGCTIDGVNSENVVWPAAQAPHGTYHVSLVYHDDCGVARSDYVVTIARAGQTPLVYTGAFVGAWEDNPDVEIGSFEY